MTPCTWLQRLCSAAGSLSLSSLPRGTSPSKGRRREKGLRRFGLNDNGGWRAEHVCAGREGGAGDGGLERDRGGHGQGAGAGRGARGAFGPPGGAAGGGGGRGAAAPRPRGGVPRRRERTRRGAG